MNFKKKKYSEKTKLKGEMMKNKIIILGFVLIIANLCSAGSVFEPTPFKNWNESSKRVDRVNLWPLFYYQNHNMSILWPMIDKRNDGHAFRPLYSVYDRGEELNILWPLSSFNFGSYEYRVANVYYKKRKKLLIFPISYFQFNRHEYWFLNTYKSKEKFIFFPLYFYEKNDHWCVPFIAGKGKNWYSVMPPLWISFNAETNDNSWFFGPLGIYNSNYNETHKFSILFKLIDYRRMRDNKELNILYFNRYINNKYRRKINFFYLSQYTKTKNNEEFYIFPLYYSKKDKKINRQLLFPLFYKSNDKKEDIFITPLFGTLKGKKVERIITPIVSFNKNEDQKFINILALGYNHIWNDKEKYSRTDIVWPIFNYTRNKAERSIYVTPIFGFKKSNKKYRLITPIVSFGKNYTKEDRFLNIAGIVFHYKKTKNRTQGFALGSLYEYNFNKNGSFCHSFLFDSVKKRRSIRKRRYYDGAIDNNETLTQKVTKTFIFRNFTSGTRVRQIGFPVPKELKGKDNSLSIEKIKEYPEIWEKYAKKNWWKQKYFTAKVPLLFSYKWNEKQYSKFDILYWLYESNRYEGGKGKSEKVQKKVLWWFMNYNRKGENVSLDVFPFITYDKIPEKEIKQFSVFWKLFRWRKEKDKRALDILFIPIINSN